MTDAGDTPMQVTGLKHTVKPSNEGFAVRFCTFKGELKMSYLILLAVTGGLSCALILATGLVSFVGRFVGYKLAGQWTGTRYPLRVPLPTRRALKRSLRDCCRDAAGFAPWAVLGAFMAYCTVAGLDVGNAPVLLARFGL